MYVRALQQSSTFLPFFFYVGYLLLYFLPLRISHQTKGATTFRHLGLTWWWRAPAVVVPLGMRLARHLFWRLKRFCPILRTRIHRNGGRGRYSKQGRMKCLILPVARRGQGAGATRVAMSFVFWFRTRVRFFILLCVCNRHRQEEHVLCGLPPATAGSASTKHT